MNQASTMKRKSVPKHSTRYLPLVSFTTDTVSNTPRQSPSSSNISTLLTDSPQVLSFENVVKKAFKKNLIASLTSKDTVLKAVRDCILRDDQERLKQLNVCLSGVICMSVVV